MKVFLIICGVIIGLVLLMPLYGFLRSIVGLNTNPIDGIHINGLGGTMGFLLGDNYRFVKSRLKHLNIKIIEDDSEDYETFGVPFFSIDCQSDFNNISKLMFAFRGEKLNCITIQIDYSSEGI